MSRLSTDGVSEPMPLDAASTRSGALHLLWLRARHWATLGDRLAGATVLVLLLAAVQLCLWGFASAAMAVAPPDDSLEQVLLSQTLRGEYGKHPPLPTWILFGWNSLFGASIGATYLLGALCSIATTLLLYAFARPLVGARRAALAAVLLSDIEYLNAGTAWFNHNTVQLPLALLAIMLFHRALTSTRWRDWALFGLGCGVMMLAKFSALVLFASFAVYLLWTGRLRDQAVCKRLCLAALAGAAVFAPYYLAVRSDPWSPNTYAMNSLFPGDVDRIQCLKTVWGFASSQVAKVLPALLVFALVRRGAPRARDARGGAVELGPFLAIVGFGPFVLTVAVAVLSGAQLLVGWGTTFHVLLTFWLVASRPFAIDVPPRALRTGVAASVLVHVALWVLISTHGGRLPSLNPTPHPPAPPTPAQLADAVRGAWAQHCAAPLHYVLTDGHTGSALAVGFLGQPRVVDALREEFPKFFPEEARIADGAIVVVQRPTGEAAPAADASLRPIDRLLADSSWQSRVELPASDGRTHAFDIGIVAPVTGPGCEYGE